MARGRPRKQPQLDDTFKDVLPDTKLAKHTNRRKTPKPTKKSIKDIAPNEGLNDKHYMFISEYIRCFNATKAHMKVYGSIYSTAMTEGSRLIGNPMIRSEIVRIKTEAFKYNFLELSDIIQKYKDIAFADMNDFVELDENGMQFTVKQGYDGSIVGELENTKFGLRIKLADRMEAMKRLEKYLYLLTDEEKMKMKLLELQLKKAEIEVKQMSGDGDTDDTHDKIKAYEEVLNASVNPFDDVEGE